MTERERAVLRDRVARAKLERRPQRVVARRPSDLRQYNVQRRYLLGHVMIRWSRSIEEHGLDFDTWLTKLGN